VTVERSADGASALSDGVVLLRPSDERDLDAIAAGMADPDVVRWLSPEPGSAGEVLSLNRERAAAGSPTFSICALDDRCLGLAWLNRDAADPAVGSVGYWLLPEARGRGLATRAVGLVVAWAREPGAIRRLRLVTAAGTLPSRAVANRAGFREAERRRRTEGDRTEEELVVYVRDLVAPTD
jgi:RimJ/RimL family protein N-acetyltransferase